MMFMALIRKPPNVDVTTSSSFASFGLRTDYSLRIFPAVGLKRPWGMLGNCQRWIDCLLKRHCGVCAWRPFGLFVTRLILRVCVGTNKP